MLWTVFFVLVVLWVVGLLGPHAVDGYIHLLLVAALVALLVRVVRGGDVKI